MPKSAIPPDIEIAQSAKIRPIVDVASELGLAPEDIEPYGHYKAKVRLEVLDRAKKKARLVLVTATSPTTAGGGENHHDRRAGSSAQAAGSQGGAVHP